MYFKNFVRRRIKKIMIGFIVIGLFSVITFTIDKERISAIQKDTIRYRIRTGNGATNESHTTRKMANTRELSSNRPAPYATNATKRTKNDDNNTISFQIKATKRTKNDDNDTISFQIKALANLKKLIETNKNMYMHDLKEKTFNKEFEERLKSSFVDNSYDKCKGLVAETRLPHDVQYFVFKYSYEPPPIDVTLLSHLTLSRGIHRIAKILAQWPGPASLSVFGTDAEIKRFLDYDYSWKRKNVAIHAVYQRNATHYPVNFMRNVALYGANTSHIWMIDADFTPNKDAYQLIKKYIPQYKWSESRPALVTPAFETNLDEGGVPDNRTQLLQRLNAKNKTIETFSFTRCRNCHKNTNWKMFVKTSAPYKIKGGGRFEPYVILQRKTIPVYDERLIARHWNKIIYDYELYALQYQFYVLPDVFIVHEPHERVKQPFVEYKCLDEIGLLIKKEISNKKRLLEKIQSTKKRKLSEKTSPSH